MTKIFKLFVLGGALALLTPLAYSAKSVSTKNSVTENQSLTAVQYDNKGQVKTRKRFDADGKLIDTTQYTYNYNYKGADKLTPADIKGSLAGYARMLQTLHQFVRGNIKSNQPKNYQNLLRSAKTTNAAGAIIESVMFTPDGNLQSSKSFNNEGKLTQEVTFDSSGDKMVKTFDYTTNTSKLEKYGNFGALLSSIHYKSATNQSANQVVENKEYGVRFGFLKSDTKNTYNSAGKLKETKVYDGSNQLTSDKTFSSSGKLKEDKEYNSGLLTSDKTFEENGALKEDKSYLYGSLNSDAKNTYNSAGKLENTKVYNYFNNLISDKTFSSTGKVKEDIEFNNNEKSSDTIYNSSGGVQDAKVYAYGSLKSDKSYNSAHRVIEDAEYDSRGIKEFDKTYSADGKLIEEKKYNDSGQMTSDQNFTSPSSKQQPLTIKVIRENEGKTKVTQYFSGKKLQYYTYAQYNSTTKKILSLKTYNADMLITESKQYYPDGTTVKSVETWNGSLASSSYGNLVKTINYDTKGKVIKTINYDANGNPISSVAQMGMSKKATVGYTRVIKSSSEKEVVFQKIKRFSQETRQTQRNISVSKRLSMKSPGS